MRKWVLIATVLTTGLPMTESHADTKADFYVATNGRDNWSGTLPEPKADGTDGPFATLARARDAVRALTKEDRDMVVLIRGGEYQLAEPVVFSLQDSAAKGHTITYAAYPAETPVFGSGVPIRNWRRLEASPPGVPQAGRGKVWTADLSAFRQRKEKRGAEDWRFFTLYDGDRPLPRARGRGFSPTKATKRTARRGADQEVLHFPEGALKSYPGLRDAEIVIVPCSFWVMNILPLASVDEEGCVAKTAVPGTYSLTKNAMTNRDNVWVENVLEVLDRPGEWVLDSEKCLLYYRPEGDRPSDGIVAPLLTELIRVEGETDYEGPKDTPVQGLVFRGLTFTHGDRLPWHGNTGRGLQHDWEMFDRPTALVRLRGAERCAIEDCHFLSSGHTAVRLDLHCRDNRIAGNHIERMGGVGILLSGFGPGTKDVNKRNEVTYTYIHHVGELYWGSVGIFAWQSGENRIAHNHIHHVPYTGIVVSGRISWDPKGVGECSQTVRWHEIGIDPKGKRRRMSWHEREKFLHGRKNLVERNDIHNAMQVLGDGNCIYVSGTGAGNIVKENYCHDCNGEHMNAVIRCDDDQHETVIERNIMHRTRGFAEGVISKGDNDIINNVIADLRQHKRHRGYIVFPYGSVKGSTVQRNILYSRIKGQTICSEGRARRPGGPAPLLRETDANRNLYYCAADAHWADGHFETQREFGIESQSVQADPLFVDPDAADFRFKPGSPAEKLGIKPLDAGAAGLGAPYRERFLGKRIRTRISPMGHELREPATITITTDIPGAEIRYTLDGSEPSRSARLYTAPFKLTEAATVKARAFADGATDLIGASEVFTPPPAPVAEDFESVKVGETAPGTETQEDNDQMTARVSDEQAASGRHSLKFVDGPGQKHTFTPIVVYRTRFKSGKMVGRFDVRVDPITSLHYQWRDYQPGYSRGPCVRIQQGGEVVHGDETLTTIPIGEWVRFEVTCTLGDDRTGTFDMSVLLPGEQQPKTFRGLACDERFKELDWVGFVANGQEDAVFYVDNIEIRPCP